MSIVDDNIISNESGNKTFEEVVRGGAFAPQLS